LINFLELIDYFLQPEFLFKDIVEKEVSDKAIMAIILHDMLSDEEKAYYSKEPLSIEAKKVWFSDWHTLIVDTFKMDYLEPLRERFIKTIEEAKMDIADLDNGLIRVGFEPLKISSMKKLIKADKGLVAIFKEEGYSGLNKYFLNKWMPRIRYLDIKNEKLFHSWIDRGLQNFVNTLARKSGISSDDIEIERVREIIKETGREYVKDANRLRRILKIQYANKVVNKCIKAFTSVEKKIRIHLGNFKEVEIDSEEEFYVCLFDDLLHLTGEFMQSGVCTWLDRARQVKSGNREGYHFATIALKDKEGRVLGFSQVQLLKTSLEGQEHDEKKGYKVLALTGLNLNEKVLPISLRIILTVPQAFPIISAP